MTSTSLKHPSCWRGPPFLELLLSAGQAAQAGCLVIRQNSSSEGPAAFQDSQCCLSLSSRFAASEEASQGSLCFLNVFCLVTASGEASWQLHLSHKRTAQVLGCNSAQPMHIRSPSHYKASHSTTHSLNPCLLTDYLLARPPALAAHSPNSKPHSQPRRSPASTARASSALGEWCQPATSHLSCNLKSPSP